MQNNGQEVAQQGVAAEVKAEEAGRAPIWTVSPIKMARQFFYIDGELGFNICVSTMLKRLLANKLNPKTYSECLQLASFAGENPKAISTGAYLKTDAGIVALIDDGNFSPIGGKAKLQDVNPEFAAEEEAIAALLFTGENPIIPVHVLDQLRETAKGMDKKAQSKFIEGDGTAAIHALLTAPENAKRLQDLANSIGDKVRNGAILLPMNILETAAQNCSIRESGEEAGISAEDVVSTRFVPRTEMNALLKGQPGLANANAVERDPNSDLRAYVLEITTPTAKFAAEQGKVLARVPLAAFSTVLSINVTDAGKGFFAIEGIPVTVLSGTDKKFPVGSEHALKAGFGLGLFVPAVLIVEQTALAAAAAPVAAAPAALPAPVGYASSFGVPGQGLAAAVPAPVGQQQQAPAFGNNQ